MAQPAFSTTVKLAVVVPTYRRPGSLRRCLYAVACQERSPDQLIVVVRAGDQQTDTVLGGCGHDVRRVEVTRPGVVAALEAGVAASDAEIIAFTDDDAAPRRDWLRRIEEHFVASAEIGGVGGRDWCWFEDGLLQGAQSDVGRVQWFGRMTSGHHVGVGPPRDVDVLKGVNMAYRRRLLEEIGFDRRLLGDGAQVHFELALGLNANRRGWRLVFDPAVAVDHYPDDRVGEDQRLTPSPRAITDAIHNETLAILEHLAPWQRLVFGAWAVGIGTRSTPGVLAAARLMRAAESAECIRLVHAQRGRLAGWRSYRRSRR